MGKRRVGALEKVDADLWVVCLSFPPAMTDDVDLERICSTKSNEILRMAALPVSVPETEKLTTSVRTKRIS
jgi:hypothetical protein